MKDGGGNSGADYSAWGLIGQVGFIVVIALGIGLAIGLGLDNLLHTKPVLTLVGVTIGFALGLRGGLSSGDGRDPPSRSHLCQTATAAAGRRAPAVR